MAGRVFSHPRKGRLSPLPSFTNSDETHHFSSRYASSWATPIFVRIPFLCDYPLRLYLPIPPRLFHVFEARFGRRRWVTFLWILLAILLWVLFALTKHLFAGRGQWRPPFGDPPTLVFGRDELQRIWQWEVASGHYQSSHPSKKLY